MNERWIDRVFTGHVSLLWHRVTLYGANAMHWAINVRAFGLWWCFHPTTRTFGGRWPWYFYASPNGTPNNCRFLFGPGVAAEVAETRRRRASLRAAR